MTAAAYLLVFWYPEEINVSTRPGPRLGSLMLQGLWWLQLHGSNCSSLVNGRGLSLTISESLSEYESTGRPAESLCCLPSC